MLAQRQTPAPVAVGVATTRRIPPPVAPRPRPNRNVVLTPVAPAAAADDWDEEADSEDLSTETPRQAELRELASHALTQRGLGNDALRTRLEHVFSASGVQPATPLRRTLPLLRSRQDALSSATEASTSTSASVTSVSVTSASASLTANAVSATVGVHAQSQASEASQQTVNPLAGLRRGRPASPPVRAPLPPRVLQLVGNVHRPAPQAEEHQVRAIMVRGRAAS